VSEQNTEIVRNFYNALARALASGNLAEPMEQWWDPECIVKPSGLFPESAEARGHEGVRQVLVTQLDAFESMQVEPLDFIDAGDQVVVPIRFGGRARHTGLEIDFSIVHVLTLRERRLLRLDMYRTEAEALEAVGLE
jgi:ketosteroid isomerase-like protein